MELQAFWERYVLKKRYIMAYIEASGNLTEVEFSRAVDLNIDPFLEKKDPRLLSYLNSRKNDPAWVFFSAWQGESLLGYSFLHIPALEEWNDSLPTLPGEARISSTFVYPESRGRGVRGQLYIKQYEYAANQGLRLWAVIERANISSIRAATKTGRIERENYLVKFAGRNVLSILTNPFKCYLLVRARRVRR